MTEPEAKRPSKIPGANAKGFAVSDVLIRPVKPADIGGVIAIDTEATGIESAEYWHELLGHYGSKRQQRFFLVAEVGGVINGFIIGEVRNWEFGARSCGWIFGMGVSSNNRLHGIGSELLRALFECFKRAGVEKVRTIAGRNNSLMLSFFRSQGMMAAPVIPLECDLP